MFAEADLLPISALQHLIYCPRQCALIHLERQWAENRWTALGRVMHDKAHSGKAERRTQRQTARGLPVRSLELGLFGVCDVVEFQPDAAPLPIEYKRGRPKRHDADLVQLCAQALCLEEMLGASIPQGRLFYGKLRRRQDVIFDDPLRQRVQSVATQLHDMIRLGQTPAAHYDPSLCDHCSLIELCMPRSLRDHARAGARFDRLLTASLGDDPATDPSQPYSS